LRIKEQATCLTPFFEHDDYDDDDDNISAGTAHTQNYFVYLYIYFKILVSLTISGDHVVEWAHLL
jgi:hypothetical protein